MIRDYDDSLATVAEGMAAESVTLRGVNGMQSGAVLHRVKTFGGILNAAVPRQGLDRDG